MTRSTDVRLSRHVTPRFPDRCVWCEQPTHDGSVLMFARTPNPLSPLMPGLGLFCWTSVRVPACGPHRVSFLLQRYLRNVLGVALLTGVIGFVLLQVDGLEPGFGGMLVVATLALAAALVLAVVLLWFFGVFVPRRFTVAVTEDYIDYRFVSPLYAKEFALVNEGAMRNQDVDRWRAAGGQFSWREIDRGAAVSILHL